MNIGVIGVGGWGKNHVRALNELNALKCICDVDQIRANELAKKYNINNYTSLEDMLNNERLDGIILSTPTVTHFELAKRILEKCIPLLIEKPFTSTINEGKELIKLAEKRHLLLTVGYIERFNPVVKYTKDLIANKRLGNVLMLEFHRENRRPTRIKDVGIILDTSVHDIDTALYLLDEFPNVVFARSGKVNGEHEEYVSIILGFNDKNAFLLSNWITPKRLRHFSVICKDGIINGNFITQELSIEEESNTIIPRLEYKEPLMLELLNFINAIDGKEEPLVKPEDALNTLRVADATILSSKTGSQIYLSAYK
jgi:UDP-N-acetylglucosamine 3-dehydrogenase